MDNQKERKVRRFRKGDGENCRLIRLEALRHAPDAFGSTYEKEAERDVAQFEDRVMSGCIFGAFSAERIVGMAGFNQQSGEKFRHKGVLWGMYVTPEFRNAGIGEDLVTAVLDHAKDLVDLVTLSVVTENASALALYSKMGFQTYGLESRALKIKDSYLSETLMVRNLN